MKKIYRAVIYNKMTTRNSAKTTKSSTSSSGWNKLSTVLSDVLSSTLKKAEADNVMTAWNNRKSEVSGMFETSTRSAKAQKDPNAPKKARSGYIFFCEENRDKAKVGTSKPTEITTRLGEMWKALKDAEQEKYNKKAQADKERYAREMATYVPPPHLEEAKRTRGAKKERTGPARPTSAYLFFCQDARAKIKAEKPDLSAKETMHELGARWNALTAEQRRPYEAKQATDKTRYETEKSGGVVSPPLKAKEAKECAPSSSKKTREVQAPKETKDAKASKTKESSKKDSKHSEKKTETKKPTKVKDTPGYQLFCEERRDDVETEHPNWSPKQFTEEFNRSWLALSNEDREAYELEARAQDTGSELEMED